MCQGEMRTQGTKPLTVFFLWLSVIIVMAVALANMASAQVPPGYYGSADTSNAATLRATLHDIIDDHTRYPYTATGTDTWDILEIADQDPDLPGNVITVYRNASYLKQGGGNDLYNREHSWPKSYGFPADGSTNYPYTDAHHLFIADSGYNSSRSNKPFDSCPACTEKPTDANNGRGGLGGGYPGDSNWTAGSFTAGAWEVWTARRGDIARAMFYMDIRYEAGKHGVTGVDEPDLVLTDDRALIEASNTGSNEAVAYMGLVSVLLQWHREDPVDWIELARNDAVAAFQGNRNPFIDNPEWAECIFGTACDPAPPPVTAGVFINEFHYDNKGGDAGEFVEVAGAAGTDLTGWQVLGYNGADGTVYATLALSGIIPDQQGCMGVLPFDLSGLQNGGPDGLALVDDAGAVRHVLAYEGSFTAADGPAAGQDFPDIGRSETSRTRVGQSLQLGGAGSMVEDFNWQKPANDTYGLPNRNQDFDGCGGDFEAPAAPAGLAAVAGDAQVDLDWGDNAEADLAGYHVYRADQAAGPYDRITGSPLGASDFTDTGLTNGQVFYYVVTAVDVNDNESVQSAEVSAMPTGGPVVTGMAWINEFHYDNDGTDTGEFIEVAGPAGLDLAGWQLLGYNGNGGAVYASLALAGSLPDLDNGYGVLAFDFAGLQNGSPDGIALVNPGGEVTDLLSYEGSLTAVDGPAAGQTLADIGVAESGTTPIGFSIQRVGSGTEAAAFTWGTPMAATPGALNTGQDFGGDGGGPDTEPPAVPAGLLASNGNRQVNLSWSANSEIDLAGYRVYRSQTSGSGFVPLADVAADSVSYQDSGLSNGTTYYYALSAFDTSGNESGLSDVVAGTPAKKGGRR